MYFSQNMSLESTKDAIKIKYKLFFGIEENFKYISILHAISSESRSYNRDSQKGRLTFTRLSKENSFTNLQ